MAKQTYAVMPLRYGRPYHEQGVTGDPFELFTSKRAASKACNALKRAGTDAIWFPAQSWKPVFRMSRDATWYDNGQRFATQSEARDSAHARFMVWTMPEDYTALPSPDPVNYVRTDGCDRSMVAP